MTSKEIESLFKTTKSKVAVQKSVGVMGAFLSAGKQSLAKCEVCGAQCSAGSKLCNKHKSEGRAIATEKREQLERLIVQRDDTYKTCRACQRYEREVLCVNMDCGIFFARHRLEDETVRLEEGAKAFYTSEGLAIDW